MRFVMEIKLGNEAMQTTSDVRKALLDVAGRLGMFSGLEFMAEMDRYDSHMQIRDENGNTVGFCEVRK